METKAAEKLKPVYYRKPKQKEIEKTEAIKSEEGKKKR